MTQDIAISVKNISKTFIVPAERRNTVRDVLFNIHRKNPKRSFQALKNINFEVKRGEFFGIIGRNGSGKSTLLKIIAQIYKTDKKGEIKISGSLSPFLELGVGFNIELTARENIHLNASLLGLSKEKIDERFDEIIRFAELEKFVEQKLKFYSSGMQLRLAFSVAIQADADIILLDEVLAVGDASFQQKCFDVFRQFKKDGKTIVFVSHDLGVMRQFCNRILYLKDSEVQMIGDSNEVADLYLYTDKENEVEEIIDSPSEHTKEKPVEITNVEFIDKFNHAGKTFICGDEMMIKVHYKKNKEKVEKPVLGIAIYREDGIHIYGTNTILQNKELKLSDKGFVQLECPSLPLIQGKFLVTIAFHDTDGVTYDWQDKKFDFFVQQSNNDSGLVALNFNFSSL